MFAFRGIREQLRDEQRKNAALTARLEKTHADIDYIAMMTDIELDNEKEGLSDEFDVSEG